MGKLTEILQKAGRSYGGSIGFSGKSANAPKPKAAAIIVSATDIDGVAALVKAGADAVLLSADADMTATKTPEVAWGVDARSAKTLAVADLKSLHERGADFVLVGTHTPMRALTSEVEHLDRVLFIAPPENDPLLMAFRSLNVVDVEVGVLDLQFKAKELANLTVEKFAQTRLLTEYLRFPVIVTLHEMPADDDVATLARLGIHGIWLTNATPEAVTQLREALERVPREKDPQAPQGIAGLTGGNSPLGR